MRLIDADALDYELGISDRDIYVRECLQDAPTVQIEPHWIPMKEESPEAGKSVLICDAYGDICIGHRTMGGYYFPDFCEDKIKDVRAWAELPEPYRVVAE